MQRETERDLVTAWQQGNLTAARQLVTMLQSEALNVAYLLTGERQDAVALAETGFLALFEQSRSGDPDIDRRIQLLTQMGQSFLRRDYKSRIEHAGAGLLLEPGPARFNVDNRRTLLLAALGRLEDRERAALVLHDFSGLETSDMNRLLERRGDPLIAPMEAARVRVRQSLDIPAGEHLRRPFVEATFDAPRIDLWLRLEEPVSEILRRSRNQSRIISFSIVAVVAVVVLVGIVTLFGEDLLGGAGDGSGAGAQPTDAPTSLPAEPTVVQSIAMQPTSTPESSASPAASVPSWLLLETWHQQDSETDAYRSLTVFDPTINRTRRLPSNDPIHLAAGSGQIRFSPDGYQMVIFREQLIDEQIHYFMTSYSTDSIGRQWETEILSIDRDPNLDPSSHTPARMAAAVTGDRVYAAVLTTDMTQTLTLHSYFRRNGMPRGGTEIPLPVQTPDTNVFHGNVLLHAPPDGDNLYLIVESFGDSDDEWRAALLTFDRGDMSLVRKRSISADLSQGYWLWASQMTPDGAALYGVHQNRSGTGSRVQFLELESGEITTITLPFTTPVNFGSGGLLMPVTSHDGQRIFILNQDGTDVAVVNLAQRRMERVFPLDRRGFEAQFDSRHEGLMFGYWSSLSADGSQLYVASWDQNDEGNPGQSGVWVVDTSLWKLTHFIPVEGFVNGIFLSPAENAIYAQIWTANASNPTHEIVRISTGSQPTVVETLDLPQSGNDYVWTRAPFQYFQTQFGHSPAIDSIPLSDNTTFSTLPRLEVESRPEVAVPGQHTSIEVRVVDPASGEPLTSAREDVRFDPEAGVTAFVHAPDQENQIVILGKARPGVYQGSLILPAEGQWTVDVALTDSSGDPWIATQAGRIDVAPAFIGSDGRAYVFQVTTEPSTPVVDEETLVRLALIDVETGEPKPDEVDVAIELDDGETAGLPDRIDIPFMHSEPGYLTATMDRTNSGAYEGTVRFWATGPWSAFIRIQIKDQPQIMIPANSVEVTQPE